MSCSRGCCPDQRTHYLSVGISSTCTPSRSGVARTRRIEAKEKGWERDFAALDSLKSEGIVPKRTDGLADLMTKATSRFEIERGKVLNANQKAQYEHITETDVK